MVEEIVVNSFDKIEDERVVNIFSESKIHLNIDTIAFIEFVDEQREQFCRNLCREGLKKIPRSKSSNLNKNTFEDKSAQKANNLNP